MTKLHHCMKNLHLLLYFNAKVSSHTVCKGNNEQNKKNVSKYLCTEEQKSGDCSATSEQA